ncbi:MAG: peroxide stress protein YaaA [Prevotella sp.]|nr:peroxide stress protein YaaA [Prevotella sp.]
MQIILASAKIMHDRLKSVPEVRKGNNLKIQAVWAKTCRGAMTRFIIQNRITNPDDLTAFSYEGFEYEPKLGEPNYPHFIKQ